MSEPTPWTSVDPLTDALYHVRMQGAFYAWTEAAGPCAVEMPRLPDCLSFHFLVRGSAWVEAAGTDPVELRPGDIAIVQPGLGHRIGSTPGLRPLGRADLLPQTMLGDHFSVMRLGPPDAQETAGMLCGVVAFETPQAQQALDVLPPVVTVRAGDRDGMSALIALMVAEVVDPRPGGEAVVTRLADVLVVDAVRAWLEGDPEARTGWLAALRDPQIGAAIAAVHRDPGAPWSLPSLAAAARLSRSAFAARFTDVAGVPPMTYVTAWRMRVARTRLRAGATVAAVAAELGYGSEAAFSRAYTRTVGTTPGTARRAPQVA